MARSGDPWNEECLAYVVVPRRATREGRMISNWVGVAASAAIFTTLGAAVATKAQDPPPPPQESPAPAEQSQPAPKPADGRRSSNLPVEAYAVVPGTKFLVRL